MNKQEFETRAKLYAEEVKMTATVYGINSNEYDAKYQTYKSFVENNVNNLK